MLRPKLNEMNVQCPSQNYLPSSQMNTLSNLTYARPNFNIHGSNTCFNSFNTYQLPMQPQHFSNTYPNYPKPPSNLVFYNDNPPTKGSSFLPLSIIDQNIQNSIKFEVEAPQMPRDPNMLRNIDVLSSFVVKNGINFENMTKKNEKYNPKFSFLFESEPGTEAAIGRKYYEWKKNALQATFHPRCNTIQTPTNLSNHCEDSIMDGAQKKMGNPFNQGYIFNEEVDMDIEGMYTMLLRLIFLTNLSQYIYLTRSTKKKKQKKKL